MFFVALVGHSTRMHYLRQQFYVSLGNTSVPEQQCFHGNCSYIQEYTISLLYEVSQGVSANSVTMLLGPLYGLTFAASIRAYTTLMVVFIFVLCPQIVAHGWTLVGFRFVFPSLDTVDNVRSLRVCNQYWLCSLKTIPSLDVPISARNCLMACRCRWRTVSPSR